MIYEDSISRAVCPVPHLCHRLHRGHLLLAPDLHKNEHRRGRCEKGDHDGYRSLSVPDRRVHRVPGFLRLSDITIT